MIYQYQNILVIVFFGALTMQTSAQNVFKVPTYNPCVGEQIAMSCYIDNENFLSDVYISFNNSQAFTSTDINDNQISGIDTSRFQVATIDTDFGRNAVQITISSYLPQDSNTIFGCHGKFYINETISKAIVSGKPLKRASPPDKISSFTSTLSTLNADDCTAKLQFNVPAPDSDRAITSYRFYSDNSYVATLTKGEYGYLYTSQQMTPGKSYTQQISAVSCGGESALSDSNTESITGYTLDSYMYLYLTPGNKLRITWYLTTHKGTYTSNDPIAIGYSLQVITKYTADDTYSVLDQSKSLNLVSTKTGYDFDLGLSSIGQSQVSLDFSTSLKIKSQCYNTITDGSVATESSTETSTVDALLLITQNSNIFLILFIIACILAVGCSISSGGQTFFILVSSHSKKKKTGYTTTTILNDRESREPLVPQAPPLSTINTEAPYEPGEIRQPFNNWPQ